MWSTYSLQLLSGSFSVEEGETFGVSSLAKRILFNVLQQIIMNFKNNYTY